MKLHLPLSLFRRLTFLMAAAACVSVASAEVMKTQHASLLTYADFGQNMGRYVTGGNVNGLLSYIREQEGGVAITYTDGTAPNTLPNGMPDFSSVVQGGGGLGAGNLIAPNAYITAQHNGTFTPSFSAATVVGAGNEIRYQGIEYRNSAMEIRSNSTVDVKITRLNKLVTDAAPAAVYSGDTSRAALEGQTVYHSGAGRQYVYNAEAEANWWQANPGTFISGGATELGGKELGNTAYVVGVAVSMGDPALSPTAPLPYQPQDGDSGSPIFIWDKAAQQYAYIGSYSSVNALEALGGHTVYSKAIFDPGATDNLKAFDNVLNTTAGRHSLRVTDMVANGKTSSVTIDGVKYDTTVYGSRLYDLTTNRFGDDTGMVVNRLEFSSGKPYTWAKLNDVMDTDNWYHYGTEYMNLAQQSEATSKTARTWSELYASRNNCFVAADSETYSIEFTSLVDTGLGYTQFSKADGVETADFVLSPYRYASTSQLLTSGYIVDKDVTLHLQFTNEQDYVREWRKVGEGTLSIEGTGDNYVLLNVGGPGKTELKREGGFAAYNVLANMGSTVVIDDIGQIARDFTFGNGGAVLDFNGNSMEWNNSAAVEADGFSIHALTQEALITNNAETAVKLTVTDGGKNFLGSFSDAGAGALTVDFNGTSWELNGIHTDLTHHEGSGLVVSGGDVTLTGTLTQHAAGTVTPGKTDAYSHADDWHYADAAMPVTVKENGTFELGSHARLKGDVTVEQGGTYIMHEGVQHAQEYVEGGQVLEDTDKYAAFYGHKGDVKLQGGTMAVQISEAADKDFAYNGAISGEGKVTVDAGNVHVMLGGDNTMSGAHEVTRGVLVATGEHSLGEGTWEIHSGAVLAAKEFEGKSSAGILASIHGDSQGVLALTADHAESFDLSAHQGLVIGAMEGKTVVYGSAETALAAQNGQWKLGGAGGTLVVESKLADNATLVLGDTGSTGTVVLNNAADSFNGVTVAAQADMELRGSFSLLDGGSMTTGDGASLNMTEGAIHSLGTASVSGNVTFGNVTTTGNLTIGGTVNLNGELHAESGTITFLDAVVNVDNSHVETIGSVYGSGSEVGGYAADANGFRGEAVQVGASIGISGNYVLEGTSTYAYGGLMPTISHTEGGTTTAIQLADDKVYYANTGVVTVGGSSATEHTAEASAFHVNENGTLLVTDKANNTLSVNSILEDSTGTGTICLATDATIANGDKVNFGGTIEVQSGKTLKLGTTANSGAADTSSLSGVTLDGGTLSYGAQGTTALHALTTDAASVLDISSTGSKDNASHRINIDTLTLNDDLAIKTTYYSALKVGQVTGSGKLTLQGASDSQWATTSKITIESLEDFTGELELSRLVNVGSKNNVSVVTDADINVGAGLVEMKGVSLSSGATATITADRAVKLGAVDVSVNKLAGAASALTVKGAGFGVDSLKLGGGSLHVQDGAEVEVGDSVRIAAAEENGKTTLTGGSVQADRISGLTATDAEVTLSSQPTYTVENMTMGGKSTLDVTSGVVYASNTTLQNLVLSRQAAVLGSEVSVAGVSHVELAANPVQLMTLAEGNQETPVVLYSEQLSGVCMLEGATLVLDLDSMLPQLTPPATLFTIVLSDLTWMTEGDITPCITLQAGEWATIRELELLSATHDENGTYINISLQTPEPATATLSLLALAALAARRKRK